jgi:predicted negative regulator of RcsB-dependent stress response
MSEHSAYDKLHVDERDKADLGGVLEQLNLPPTFVAFVRRNQNAIYIGLSIVTVLVVVWSLYDAHIEKQRTASSSALALAQKLDGEKRLSALEDVVEEYSGTGSALWAKVEIGRYYMENSDFATALQYYQTIRSEVETDNPLYQLVTFGIAQADEALAKFDEAIAEYGTLKTVTGYESIGYNGTGRIYEVQGNLERAVNEYEQYMGTMTGSSANNPEKLYIEAKLSALKAQM